MRVIGITGGVGAGKSAVLAFLSTLPRCRTVQADAVGRTLSEKGGACYAPVAALFGPEILDADGEIDRAKLAGLVFSDPERLAALNAIIHPQVRSEIAARIRQAEQDGISVFFLEAAILKEGGLDTLCDEIWYIYADADVREQRLSKARGYTRERTRAVMRRQKSDAQFRQECDVVIDNSGDFEQTKQQMMKELER